MTFTEGDGIGRGLTSALACVGDTVWVASLVDTTVGSRQAGNGLSFSTDAGSTWRHIPNQAIFDTAQSDFISGPTSTVDNACFGLAIDGQTIWATFFAGGSVRSRDSGDTWERILPDGLEDIIYIRDGGIYLPHRTFSVLAYGDTVWIGSAGGIGRSFDGGETWQMSDVKPSQTSRDELETISGNWVLAIERNIRADGRSIIWAGTGSTSIAPLEVDGMSWTVDHGQTWQFSGPTFAWDFAFTADRIWAATNLGLLSSSGAGETWEFVQVEDDITGRGLTGAFAAVEIVGDGIWVGTDNGLGLSTDGGRSWFLVPPYELDVNTSITRSFIEDGDHQIRLPYLVQNYPNPFNSETTFQFYLADETQVELVLHNLAGQKIATLASGIKAAGMHTVRWNSQGEESRDLSSGIYLYRLQTDRLIAVRKLSLIR